jgi:hypothetical protein
MIEKIAPVAGQSDETGLKIETSKIAKRSNMTKKLYVIVLKMFKIILVQIL